jgi:NAD dependent epimerase/dehydratase family enzyme
MTFCIISTTNFQEIYWQMKIIITGATGLIGKSLCENLVNRGDEITVFTRNIINAKQSLKGIKKFVEWETKYVERMQ